MSTIHRSVHTLSAIQVVAWMAQIGIASCAHQPVSLDSATFLDPTKSESIVVMAVPPDATLTFLPGQDDGVTWSDDGGVGNTVASTWGSFVVFKVNPTTARQTYGLDEVQFGSRRGSGPEEGKQIPVVHAVPGRVTFVGGVAFEFFGDGLAVILDRSVTLERAQAFMQRAYPNMPPMIEGEPVRFLKVGRPVGVREPLREGFISGGSVGFFGGPVALRSAAAQRFGIGSGSSVVINLGAVWRDRVPLTLSWGLLQLSDRQPFSEFVVDCTTFNDAPLSCGDRHSQDSSVTSGELIGLETGYQYRFRPSGWASLLPAALVGYVWSFGEFSRGVACEGCSPSIPIHDVNVGGLYVGPSFKFTLNAMKMAISARSEFFLRGDLGNRTLIGIEFGAP